MSKASEQTILMKRHTLLQCAHGDSVSTNANLDFTEEEGTAGNDKEARFRDCLDNMLCRIGLYSAVRDESGNIVDFICEFVNKAVCLEHGKTKAQLIGRHMADVWGDAKGALLAEYSRVCETGEPYSNEAFDFYCEREGRLFGIYEIQVSKWGDGVAVSSRNISERKNMEAQLARLDRLNLVGQMAASIGHEIRNPLTVVRGYMQLFQRKEKYAEHQEQFELIIGEIDRANAIITEYLALAKNKIVELKPGNINKIVVLMSPLLQADAVNYGHHIQIEASPVPDIALDEKEIRQLILNLVRNSHEAMRTEGTVTIKTFLSDDKITLAIQDTGQGIPEEVLSKLGTPFVTTKENGTGLGLAVCYRIAERHGAEFEVKTSSTGTSVFVKFDACSMLPQK